MHPYAGDPTNYPEDVDIIDDSDPPNASNFNVANEGALDRTENLRASTARVGEGWRKSFLATALNTAAQSYQPAADIGSGTFLVPVALGPTLGAFGAAVYWSYGADDDAEWAQVGLAALGTSDTTGYIDIVACSDSTPGIVWCAAALDNSAQLVIKHNLYTSGSWVTAPGGTISMAATTVKALAMAAIGSRIVVGVGGFPGAALGIYTGSASVAFTQVGSIAWGPTDVRWIIKSNGSVCLVVPGFFRTNGFLWTTTDGITFTARDISALVPVGAYIAGLAWAPLKSLWYLAVQTSGTTTAFYSSPDGASWTIVPGTGPNLQIADLECSSNGLVLTILDVAFVTTTLESRFYFSTDWGVHWRASGVGLFDNLAGGAEGYTRARLAAGPLQLLAGNSKRLRFSQLAGFPAPTP